MDGQTLQQLFSGSNPFLAQMGEQAFNLGQQKQQADLATTLGLEQRNQAMHPLEMESKRQAARMTGGQADIYADQLARKIPVEDERKAALQKSIAGMDDTSRAQMKAQVVRNMQLAAMMEKNGGQLPQGFNLSPEEMQIFTPKNLKSIIAHGQAFMEMDPEEISKRQRAAEAERLAKIRGQVQMDVKGTPSAGSGKDDKTPSMDNAGIIAQMSKLKEARQKLAFLKTVLPQLPEEQQQQWQGAYNGLKRQAEEELRARTAGDVDIAATTKGRVPVTPSVNLGDAPGAVTNRPARQTPQVSQSDLEFTAKKHGITVEEVKKRLGIK